MKTKHYGKELKKAIKNRGFKKVHIFRTLGISKPTLDKRLEDGDFSEAQKILIDKHYLS